MESVQQAVSVISEPIKVKKTKKTKKSKVIDGVVVDTNVTDTGKSKGKSMKKVKSSTSVSTDVIVERPATKKVVKFVEELIYIPVPRVRNYINKIKMNRSIEEVLTIVSEAEKSGTELSTVLSESHMETIGKYMETRESIETSVEKKWVEDGKKEEDKPSFKKLSELSAYEIAGFAISKLKYKFSNDSFQVVSIMLDRVIMEITELTIKNVLLSKKSTIVPEFSVTNGNTEGRLYSLYSKSQTYLRQLELLNAPPSEETSEETPVVESESELHDDTTINFEFHVRKIVNKLKSTNEDYSNIKISKTYCTYCSNIVLDILDRVVAVLTIIVNTIHNKTITKDIFSSIFQIMLIDNGVDVEYVSSLAEEVTGVMSQVIVEKATKAAKAKELKAKL